MVIQDARVRSNNGRVVSSERSRIPRSIGVTDIRTNKCIVLDLDETLISASPDFDKLKRMGIFTDPNLLDLRRRIFTVSLNDIEAPRGSGSVIDMWVLTRPHLTEFLIFCFSYFSCVCVWSAGKFSYVHSVCDNISRDVSPFKAIYTYNDCVQSGGHWIKPLRKMSKDPRCRGFMRLDNTFIIDDKRYTMEDNPDNGIVVPGYSFSSKSGIQSYRTDDPTLLQLRKWFLTPEVRNSTDVRNLNKRDIFNQ